MQKECIQLGNKKSPKKSNSDYVKSEKMQVCSCRQTNDLCDRKLKVNIFLTCGWVTFYVGIQNTGNAGSPFL